MRYCGALKGIVAGGLQHLFSPIQVGCSPINIQYTPLTLITLKKNQKIDLENEIWWVQNELVEEERTNQVLLEHLLTLLRIVFGKQKTLKEKNDHGLVPCNGIPIFKCNVDDSGWSLKCRRDFLE